MTGNITPETDAVLERLVKNQAGNSCDAVVIHHARKLEKERDEAMEHLQEIKEYGTEEINAAVELRQKLTQALVDSDNMQDQRDLAMKVIKRLECELAEAREALREIWQSGDAFLPYVDEKTTSRWRKAAGLEETK